MYASTGESSFEMKTEADSNDITDDKLRPNLCTLLTSSNTKKKELWPDRKQYTLQ